MGWKRSSWIQTAPSRLYPSYARPLSRTSKQSEPNGEIEDVERDDHLQEASVPVYFIACDYLAGTQDDHLELFWQPYHCAVRIVDEANSGDYDNHRRKLPQLF
uniref:Uncharacterized protein n=1 Tax=Coccidioides posadasii RMSCC 3488 TaxID=454284 RepID=A0A0J6FUR5_COCPO|nr:hypothetical protein CPAG_09184 [Coccidioides posadasii RMSCC 3488]